MLYLFRLFRFLLRTLIICAILVFVMSLFGLMQQPELILQSIIHTNAKGVYVALLVCALLHPVISYQREVIDGDFTKLDRSIDFAMQNIGYKLITTAKNGNRTYDVTSTIFRIVSMGMGSVTISQVNGQIVINGARRVVPRIVRDIMAHQIAQ